MDNGVPLTAGGLISLNSTTYLHYVVAIRFRLYVDGREAYLEPGNLLGWSVNNTTIGGGLESILEGVSGVCNSDGEVVIGSNSNNQKRCRWC